MKMNQAQKVLNLLSIKNLTLSTAESCTGGLIGGAITDIPGSSRHFRGGVIAYDNQVKEALLKVPHDILVKHGAVSGATVLAMAEGAAALLETDCAISVSGIAGPEGGTPQKPVGLVFIGVTVRDQSWSFEHNFTGDRKEIRESIVDAALEHLADILERM